LELHRLRFCSSKRVL